MLSIYTLKSAKEAVNYYQQDNYYAKEEDLSTGIWFGTGAKLLNLTTAVNLQDFREKLEGKLTDNIKIESNKKTHRPGYDLTFSAPKSVSILAIIGKDERVLQAHKVAVDNVLNYLEQHYAQARVKGKHEVTIEKTNNLLIAKFEHTDSRALDPNLHTHCVVMNATLRADQKWRSLYFDEIYSNKMLLGVIYRGKLAQELMKAGFEIVQTSEQGLFELKGFSAELIKQFSKRREQITTKLKEQGLTGGKAAQVANFNTREPKKNVDLEHLELAWTVELQQCGSSLEWLKEYSAKALARGPVIPPNPYHLVYQAITKAVNELSKWHAVFTIAELKKLASGLSISNYAPTLLEKALAEQFKTGELLYLGDNLCTTQAARDLEILNVVNMRQDRNKISPMFSKMAAKYVTVANDPGLKQSLTVLLTNTDRQMVVTATNTTDYANTLHPFVTLAYRFGFYPIGLTQKFNRIKTFNQELGIKTSQTIDWFLNRCEQRAAKMKQSIVSKQLYAKRIWILDLASNVAAEQVNALQKYARKFGARIIWADNLQNPQTAINALLQRGVKRCNLGHQINLESRSALISHPRLNHDINVNNNFNKLDWQTNTAEQLLYWVIQKYQQRDAVFSLKDIKLELFSLGITVPQEVLEKQLKLELQQSLIKVNEQLVTTKDTVNLEQTCLNLVQQGQNTVANIIEPSNLVINQKLTRGQQQAIELILTTKDRVVGVQGVAGSGKTTMLRELNKLCITANFSIIGLTVTSSALMRLKSGSKDLISEESLLKAGIKTFTVRSFLINSEKLLATDASLAQLEYGGNKLYILDEASFVSTEEMVAVINKMRQLNVRLIVIGDYQQLNSVDAGRIFYLMLGSKMLSVVMTENVRFKSEKALSVMKNIYNEQLVKALHRLEDSLIEIPDHQERLSKMVQLYLQKTKEEQANTILITPEHVDRKIVNNQIRAGLIANGTLTGSLINCYNLNQVKLTKAEQQSIYYFKEEDWVCFSQVPACLSNKIKREEYYQIKHKDLEARELLLVANNEQQIRWSPELHPGIVTVYQQEERNLMQHDQIRWLKNNKLIDIYNGETAVVVDTNLDGKVTIKLEHGKEIALNVNELSNQHWDYAYAATAFVAQGAERPVTIALARGGYGQEIITKNIKVGDVIMTKIQDVAAADVTKSIWVKVVDISQDYLAKVQDRNNNTFMLDLKKSPTDSYYNATQAIWYSYPNPHNRKPSAIPKLTSVSEFLVSVTRGDQVIILVDHLESYQHTLQQRISGSQSALEYLAPNRQEVKEKVLAMTKDITGQAVKVNNAANVKYEQTKNSLYNTNLVTSKEIIEQLNTKVLQYATNWLGRPKKISGSEARWGNKGSLVVKLSGTEAGYWHDFERGKGGKNLLSLYMDCTNLEFKDAIKQLSNELNLGTINKLFVKQPERSNLTANISQLQTAKIDLKKISYALKIYDSGISINGTLAEKYLRDFRGILGKIPSDFRFCARLKHPDLGRMRPALLAPLKNAAGKIQGIVRIFLNKDGNKLNDTYADYNGKEQLATAKANLGKMAHTMVVINKATLPGVVYIAEGIETALSVSQAKPLETVVAALSVANIKNVPLPVDTQKVILCADHDGVNAASNQVLLKAAKFYLEQGIKVAICEPEKITGKTKIDFNDVLKTLGVKSIERSLQQAEPQTLARITKALEQSSNPKEVPQLSMIRMQQTSKEMSR